MSTSTLLKDYARYNLWANHRISTYLNQCTEEQFFAKNNSSFGSIANTVYHIYIADALWYKRLSVMKNDTFIPIEELSQSEIMNLFLDQSEALYDIISSFSQEEIDTTMSYSNQAGEKFSTKREHMIQHCINHATFHRGQLIIMLREIGFRNFLSVDFIHFVSEEINAA